MWYFIQEYLNLATVEVLNSHSAVPKPSYLKMVSGEEYIIKKLYLDKDKELVLSQVNPFKY